MRKGCRDSGNGESKGLEKPLKKGPWSSDEDAILIEYVKKHGTGKWNVVQKYSGLSRCGKSCRLRWLNHLRPDLCKGAFTSEEERIVIELHAIYGTKWAKMARMLPGRTDNEIKNFWYTRQKRLSRAGLPLYPDNIGQVRFNADQSGQNIDTLAIGDAQDQGAVVGSGGASVIPEIKFEHLDLKSDYCEWLLSSLPSFITSEGGDPFRMNLPLQSSQFNSLPDSHLLGNATYPYSSVPFTPEGKNLELPSFQHVNTQDTGALEANTSIAMRPQESADTSIHSPDQTPSNCPSSHYDGQLLQSPSPVIRASSSVDNSWDEFTMSELLAMM